MIASFLAATTVSQANAIFVKTPPPSPPTATLHANVGFVHAPGFVGRLEMPPHALLQFWTVPLHPAPHGRMVSLQPALVKQLFDVSQR
jgi:hypothetical protein